MDNLISVHNVSYLIFNIIMIYIYFLRNDVFVFIPYSIQLN